MGNISGNPLFKREIYLGNPVFNRVIYLIIDNPVYVLPDCVLTSNNFASRNWLPFKVLARNREHLKQHLFFKSRTQAYIFFICRRVGLITHWGLKTPWKSLILILVSVISLCTFCSLYIGQRYKKDTSTQFYHSS